MKKLIAGCVMLWSAAHCTPILKGFIFEKETLAPVIGANIQVSNSEVGVASNEFGSFTLSDLMPGVYTLNISSIGFKKVNIPVVLKEVNELLSIQLEKGIIELNPVNVIRDITSLIGLSQNFLRVPGSGSVIGALDLKKFADTDITRIIARIPGVYVQEEDGFGLRPNIGMRGTGVERSSKINMMEDGIPIAPAPYASPAAYYSPTAGRMEAIEVQKGSSQIKYGPNTTGGAVNYVSSAIPNRMKLRANMEAGSWGLLKTHINVGTSGDIYGILLESFSDKTDGFKKLPKSDPTGYNKQDYLMKIRLNTPKGYKIPTAIELKVSTTDEISNETYLGLTHEDFLVNPLRRYAASALDEMNADHKQMVLTGVVSPIKNLHITASVYNNEFNRNWYKLSEVGGSDISSILNSGNTHEQYGFLDTDSTDNIEYEIKANNRMYQSNGIQLIGRSRFHFLNGDHNLLVGIRKHTDEMDQYQKVDKYGMQGGNLALATQGIWGAGKSNNRLDAAEGTSCFLEDEIQFGIVNLTAGVRAENILVERFDWKGTFYYTAEEDNNQYESEQECIDAGNINCEKIDNWDDPNRLLNPTIKSKKMSVVVPGIGLVYQLNPSIQLLAGVHKGFSPPGPGVDDIHPEESINFEWGGRLRSRFTELNAIAFHNRYKNLLGEDTQFSGEGTYDQFNAGKVNVDGLELSTSHKINTNGFWIPLTFNYTFTKTKFLSSFESEFDGWGGVTAGDELPYVPAHQIFAETGLTEQNWKVYLRYRYMSSMRTEAGSGVLVDSKKTDPVSIVDLTSEYRVTKNVDVYMKVLNILDYQGIVAARPAGVRPTMPRAVLAGIRFSF